MAQPRADTSCRHSGSPALRSSGQLASTERVLLSKTPRGHVNVQSCWHNPSTNMILLRLLLLLLSSRLASATPDPTTGIKFRGFDCFNAQTRRVMQPTLCATSSSPMPKPTPVLVFDLFQLPTDTPLRGKGCSLRISQITGRCGMWSHYEFVSPPSFLSPTTLHAPACQQLGTPSSTIMTDLVLRSRLVGTSSPTSVLEASPPSTRANFPVWGKMFIGMGRS